MTSRGVDAPALRFLLLCGGGWIILRTLMVWNSAVPVQATGARVPWTDADTIRRIDHFLAMIRARPVSLSLLTMSTPQSAGTPRMVRTRPRPSGTSRDLAPMVSRLESPTTGLPHRGVGVAPRLRSAPSVPTLAEYPGINRQRAGWSLAGWLYLREGSATATGGFGAASQLGGGQAGLRLAYGFGETGRLRAYARATVAVQRVEQREIAVGLALAPFARVPIDVAIEQRIAAGKDGRTAFAAMVTGGVSDIVLPAHFRLEAYAQAGIVGARRRDGFADGALVVDRALGADASSPLRLGVVAAAAVQPGASRVDIGPRLTLRLPDLGQGGRIALDWRHRIAGDSSPDSGVALTLAADF